MSRKIPCPQCGFLCGPGSGLRWHIAAKHEGVAIGGKRPYRPKTPPPLSHTPLTEEEKIRLAEKHKLLL